MRNHPVFRSFACVLLGMLLIFPAAVPAEEARDPLPPDAAAGAFSTMSVYDGITYGIPADEVSVKEIITKTRELVEELPYGIASNINDIKVIGYASYNDLPGNWGRIQDKLKIFSGNLIDAFTNLDEKESYFTMALTMCATKEPIQWLSEKDVLEKIGKGLENASFSEINEAVKIVADAKDLKAFSGAADILDLGQTGVHSYCDIMNRMRLLKSIDWDRAAVLADAWAGFGNQEMKDIAGLLHDLQSRSKAGQSEYIFLSEAGPAGLGKIVEKTVDLTVAKVAPGGGLIYEAALFGVDMLTRFTALSGTFKDMECAARSMEACRDELKDAVRSYDSGLDNALASESSRELTPLFRRLAYAGINYAQACAIMDGTYADYVKIGSGSMLGVFIIRPETEHLAVNARNEKEAYSDKAEELEKLLEQYERQAGVGEQRQKAVEKWTHHWRMKGHPTNTMDISCTWDGTPELTVHFEGERDFHFLFVPYEDQNNTVAYFGDVMKGFSGTLMLDRPEDGQMEAYFIYQGDLDEKSRLFPYIMKNGSGVEPSVYVIADDPDKAWVRHWEMEGHPENTLDIVETPEGKRTVELLFEKAGAYIYDLDLDSVADMEGVAAFGEYDESILRGYMWLDLETGDRMRVMILYQDGDLPPDDPLYPYVAHGQEDFLYYVAADPEPPSDETVILDDAEAHRLLNTLSEFTLTASAGAGAWEGLLNVDADGGFSGYYYDADAGDEVIYEVSFSGFFNPAIEKVGNTYWFWVEEMNTREVPGSTAVSVYGDRVEYTDPPFFDREYMILTLPGTPNADIPETVQGEIGGTTGEWDDFSGYYTLTRWEDGWGFFADASSPERIRPERVPTVSDPVPPQRADPTLPVYDMNQYYAYSKPGGSFSYQWGSSMFMHEAQIYNADLAMLGGVLSWAIEDERTVDISALFAELGIRDGKYLCYNFDDNRKGTRYKTWSTKDDDAAFALGRKVLSMGQKDDTTVIFVIGRGTMKGHTREALDADFLHKGNGPDTVAGRKVYQSISGFAEAMWQALEDYLNNNPVETPHVKFLVTGHSLGGAMANCLGAWLTDGLGSTSWLPTGLTQEDIYVYTYGAIKVMDREDSVSDGFENIHNIYNEHDTFGPKGGMRKFGVSLPGAKFGHTDEFSLQKKEKVGETLNHEMPTYLTAVDSKSKMIHCGSTDAYQRRVSEETLKARESLAPGDRVFELLSRQKLVASDSIGHMNGELTVTPNGRFTGYLYENDEPGIYVSTFSGTFSEYVEWQGDTACLLTVGGISSEDEEIPGAVSSTGRSVIFTNPPFDEGARLLLTMPGTPDGDIPYTVKSEIGSLYDRYSDYSRYYTLTREDNGFGFFADETAPETRSVERVEIICPDLNSPWTGYWKTDEDIPSEMIITPADDKTLKIRMFFLRDFELEAAVRPVSDLSMRFSIGDGEYRGVIARMDDGSLKLTFNGGTMLEEDESEIQYYFNHTRFLFRPVTQADLWYDESGAVPSHADWLGEWTAGNSVIRITDGGGSLNLEFRLDGSHAFSGPLEEYSEDTLDFYTDEFGCMLTLNMKHRAILAHEIWAYDDSLNSWLDENGIIQEFRRTGN